MALHTETGKEGEKYAAAWLESNGYTIIQRNWRYSRFEIDIIASLDDCIHFIEVKTRTGWSFGFPEEAVDKKKLRQMIAAGAEFLFQSPPWDKVRYDILAVNIDDDDFDVLFIEDVYL